MVVDLLFCKCGVIAVKNSLYRASQ